MQVTIIAAGSRGDVQPYVALGHGLKQAGHAVRLVASEDFQDLIAAHGLAFFNMGANIEGVAQAMEGLLERGNFLQILSRMGPAAQRLVGEAAAAALEASAGSDRIVAGLGGLFVGLAISEKLGIPLVPAYLYPFTPTGAFPSVLSPLPHWRLPSWANRFSHRMGQQMLWHTFRAADNEARRKVLHIAPAPFWGPFRSLEEDSRVVLCGYSQQVIARPKDWSDSIHVTGYWFLEPPAAWEPPPNLVAFLKAGPPPVYVGFGSMVNRRPKEVARLVLSALEQIGQRGVIATGWGGLRPAQLPKTVFMTGAIPHSWLFPRMAAVVHHGGVGTTAASLRAGVPAVVTPFFGDQPFWADRVHQLGVGPRPIPRRHLTAQRLAVAMQAAVTSSAMRDRSAQVAELIRREDGVRRAVEVLERAGGTIRPTRAPADAAARRGSHGRRV